MLPSVFAGIKTPMLTMLRTRNMLRHILVNLRNTVPSSPTFSTSCASVVLFTGVNQAKRLLPISGGACFSSAYLSLGAYTTEFRGRSKENIRVIKTITPTEVPKDAQKAVAANWNSCQCGATLLDASWLTAALKGSWIRHSSSSAPCGSALQFTTMMASGGGLGKTCDSEVW